MNRNEESSLPGITSMPSISRHALALRLELRVSLTRTWSYANSESGYYVGLESSRERRPVGVRDSAEPEL